MKIVALLLISCISINSISQRKKEVQLYPQKKGDKWGYVNKKNKVMIHYQFDEAYPFIEDLAIVKKSGKYGFIDPSANIIFDCIYDKVGHFIGDYARVRKDSLEALLKKDKTIFLDRWFFSINQFHNEYAKIIVKNENLNTELKDAYLVGYLDKCGKLLVDRWYSGGGNFSDGLAKISISGEYFFLDTAGNLQYRIQETYDEGEPYNLEMDNIKIEEMPQFPGGELGLRRYIAMNLKYPIEAREKRVQGKVYVRMLISKQGKVENVSVVKSDHYLLNDAALDVINSLPKWIPGKANGEFVNVWYTIPINFRLH